MKSQGRIIPSARLGFSAWPRLLLLATVAIGVTVMSMVTGVAVTIFPASFILKVGAGITVILVVVVAMVASRLSTTHSDGRLARGALMVWVFLTGALPAYIPFKFSVLPGLNPLRLALALSIIAWLFGLISSSIMRRRLLNRIERVGTPVWILLIFFAWQVLSAGFGEQPVSSLYSVGKIYLTPMLLFFMVLTIVRDRDDVVRLCMTLALGALIGLAFVLLEWRFQTNFILKYFPIGAEDQAGLEWILSDKSRDGTYRVSGVFAHPLVLGEFSCLVLPLVCVLALRPGWKYRLLGLVMVPGLLLAVYVSHTRSALISAGVAMVALAIMLGLRAVGDRARLGRALAGWMTLLLASAMFLSLVLFASYLATGRSSGESGSTRARVWMLNRGIELLADSPLTGFGAGLSAFKIGFMTPGQTSLTIDSYYLSVALEAGYVGLLLFAAAMVLVLFRAFRGGLSNAGWHSALLAALFASLLANLNVKGVLSLTHLFDLQYFLVGLICLLSLPPLVKSERSSVPDLRLNSSEL